MHAFEAEDGPLDAMEVKLPPNRYNDAASHLGLARELAAILDLKLSAPESARLPKEKKGGARFTVRVEDVGQCPRYAARYFDEIKIKPSPAWMQQALVACGLRPISNVVDIMNYVMLETGQPLHAFDFDKLKADSSKLKAILVRRAKKGERFTSLDGVGYELDGETLMIADREGPLAIAGIKGGKRAEVSGATVQLVVEAANFTSAGIYRTSKRLGLVTDASVRFSHALSPALAEEGLARASELLVKFAGARAGEWYDSQKKAPPKEVLKFDSVKFEKLIGAAIAPEKAVGFFKRLGFPVIAKTRNAFLVEVPPWRTDIETHEDLAEEAVRLMGVDGLRAVPPRVALGVAEEDEMVREKERVRRILSALGADEVYLPSMVAEGDRESAWGEAVALENPISREFAYLRPSLLSGLSRAAEENLKHFDGVRMFEVGKIFARDKKGKVIEKISLALAVAGGNRDLFFTLKGLVAGVCKGMGVADFLMVPAESGAPRLFRKNVALVLEIEGEKVGWLGAGAKPLKRGHMVFAELDFEALVRHAEGEAEYRPLPRFPSVMRDISITADAGAHVGDIIQDIQLVNRNLIADVDLIDEYTHPSWREKQGLTFRIVFQSEERTLSAAEVDAEMKKIIALLRSHFGASVR